MKKVMLVCNAGMSTGILAKKITEASDGAVECKAYGEAQYLDHIGEGYKMILLGPQIRYLKGEIEQASGLPVEVIPMQFYGIMNGKGVYDKFKNQIEEL